VRSHPREQGDGQPGTPHEGVSQGQRVESPLARGLGHHGVAGQRLDELGVHLHAHRVVPAGDVGHGAGQGLALRAVARGELTLDLAEVPPHTVDAAFHVGAGQTPGLADLPHEEEGKQVALFDQSVHRIRDP
jgi:hypothetical protein